MEGERARSTPEERLATPTYYVDAAEFSGSLYTIAVTFGQKAMDSENATLIPLVHLKMSPAHAKALVLLFAAIVQQYEQINGQLPVDPAVGEMFERAIESNPRLKRR